MTALNNTEEAQEVSIPVWQIGVKEETTVQTQLITSRHGFTDAKVHCAVKNGLLTWTLPPKSAIIWKED